MDLLAANGPLRAVRGKTRAALTDHRAPLLSPVTVLVAFLHAVGFRWYGAEKQMRDGSTGTTCFLDTTIKFDDGQELRRVAWSFIAGDRLPIASDPVSIVQVCHFFDASQKAPEKPIPRGAEEVLRAIRVAKPELWTGERLFNDRGRLLLEAATACSNQEGRRLLGDTIEIYRGFAWKLATPVGHPPHPIYGYPLERHLRYRKGRRTGDIRASICRDERMEELRMFGLR